MMEEGVCKEVGELRSLFQLHRGTLHSRVPPLEGLLKFLVEHTCAHL